MAAYSSGSSSSSSMYFAHYSEEPRGQKSFHSSLHSIRRPQGKPWKKPIAPLPPTPPRVYKVDPMNFRDLVQRLTGAASHHQPHQQQEQPQQRLQNFAPPPLHLDEKQPADAALLFRRAAPFQLLPSPGDRSSEQQPSPFSALCLEMMTETVDAKSNHSAYINNVSDSVITSTSLELNLSPSSQHCWYPPLLSPGNLSSLDPQRTIL